MWSSGPEWCHIADLRHSVQVGDLVRYTDYDTEHKQGVRVIAASLSPSASRWGEPLWRVKHVPGHHPFTHKGGWKQPKDLEVISASR